MGRKLFPSIKFDSFHSIFYSLGKIKTKIQASTLSFPTATQRNSSFYFNSRIKSRRRCWAALKKMFSKEFSKNFYLWDEKRKIQILFYSQWLHFHYIQGWRRVPGIVSTVMHKFPVHHSWEAASAARETSLWKCSMDVHSKRLLSKKVARVESSHLKYMKATTTTTRHKT